MNACAEMRPWVESLVGKDDGDRVGMQGEVGDGTGPAADASGWKWELKGRTAGP